ncbi:DNA cytosine methyltransferase [Streptomyces chitinivorans]|uniref:DNA (cytosine-5-)-methyltransferase n=1 Tax=Streptomyces chitinivorans TaxID=1257027 RepID=A0ABW7HU83_9ACTN|nr:DNA cytosine methyltransferase [Streptomyces chitinivorans]MDH2408275.1 DNA cytosine methyltransferase [Streptomyces chitinivorans]
MVEQRGYEHVDRTSVELFAGGGGLAMGVHHAGFRPLLFNEFNNRACETLEASATRTLGPDGIRRTLEVKPQPPAPGEPAPLFPNDVQNLDLTAFHGKVDLLAGGPPCQPFSAGGVAKGDEDKRNMFPAVFKAIRQIQPKAVICENVRGLLRPSFRDYFEYIKHELTLPFVERDDEVRWQEHDQQLTKLIKGGGGGTADQRYVVRHIPVNAADYGVPQIRHRVIIVAFREDLGVDVDAFVKEVTRAPFGEEALYRTMRDEDSSYWQRHKVPDYVRDEVRARLPKNLGHESENEERKIRPWRTLRDAIQGYGTDMRLPALPAIDLEKLDRKTEQGGSITDHIGWPNARIYKGHTPNELDRPAKTVKAGVHGVPGGESVVLLDDRERDASAPGEWRRLHRYMTVRETARVMTFPDEWHGAGPRGEKMRQLGNAVPVVLAEFFAKKVAAALASVGH